MTGAVGASAIFAMAVIAGARIAFSYLTVFA